MLNVASAATPCDFKGLSVGDRATPQQIMQRFGVTKYADSDTPLTPDQLKARLERAKEVSLINALEEEEWKQGPACDKTSCRIPYGITVGEGPFPINVGVFIAFDKTEKITAIDLSYSKSDWDDVLQLLNTKYGNNWRKDETEEVTTDYKNKKSELDTVTVLTHRNLGTNPKTGDKCSIIAMSRDVVFLHTTPPAYKAVLEIRIISKNF